LKVTADMRGAGSQGEGHPGRGLRPSGGEPTPGGRPSALVLCLEPDGTVADMSPGLVEVLGLGSLQEARCTSLLESPALVKAGLAQDLRRCLETGQPAVSERHYLGQGGRRLRLRCELRPIKSSDGRIRHLVAIFEDVTSFRQREERMGQVERMEAMGRLSAGVAHDLNNYLTAILGYADLLLESMPSHGPQREGLLEIRNTGQRAAGLVRRLLAFGRRQALQPTVVDLNELILDMRGVILSLIGERVELVTSLEPALETVRVDSAQMEQVILNLVVNAKEAMPTGGRLLIETRNVFLDQEHGWIHGVELEAGPYVMMAVTDTGVGMDEVTQSKVFEPFFSTKEKGTGLGLSVVYGIVKQSGGYIWVYSEPSMGSTFKVYLPACGQPAERRPRMAPGEPARWEGKVLLVEDDDRVRDLVRAMLVRWGCQVFVARNGPEAMELAQANPGVDLLLTDLVMPGMSGVELWERLSVLQPRMRVLFMSGYPDGTARVESSELRHLPFLSKPFTAEELRLKLGEVMCKPVPQAIAGEPGKKPVPGRLSHPSTARVPEDVTREEGPPRILIVDDEAPVRRLLSRLLEGQGYECGTAGGPDQAREMLSREKFQLLLCDVRMPGQSGLELVKEVMPRYPETAVVFVSGLDDPSVARMALEQGAYGYILKPFRSNEVLIQVANALRRRQLEIAGRVHLQELERKVHERTQELQRSLSDLRQAVDGVVRAMSLAIEARDPYTAGHQRRVAELSRAIAKDLGVPAGSIEGLYMAGLIHDLGKISVPAEILSKPSRLSDVEFGLIRSHPEVGYQILRPIQFPWPVAEMVRQHHEKMDGSGYPQGLRGEDILLEARILVVADVVEAIASHRPYRPALGVDRALEEIEGKRGILYDPQVVDACLKLFREKGLELARLEQGP
jgi:putative two-component system response regulator